jgi:hypothetical protein
MRFQMSMKITKNNCLMLFKEMFSFTLTCGIHSKYISIKYSINDS